MMYRPTCFSCRHLRSDQDRPARCRKGHERPLHWPLAGCRDGRNMFVVLWDEGARK